MEVAGEAGDREKCMVGAECKVGNLLRLQSMVAREHEWRAYWRAEPGPWR